MSAISRVIAASMRSRAPAAVILVRLAVGLIFFEEGLQKFLFPDVVGAGRFARIGIPAPHFTGPFVGAVEVVCGAMIVLGLLTRLASVPLLIDISVAILSTKVPIALGHSFGPFSLPKLSRYGIWAAFSEARTDYAMLMGLVFLLTVGGGWWSLDAPRASSPPPNRSGAAPIPRPGAEMAGQDGRTK